MRQLGVALGILVLAVGLPARPAAQAGQADPAFKQQFEQGQRALKAGKYKEAIEALKKASKLHGDSCGQCYLLLGVAYYHSGELTQCEESCDKAIAMAGDDVARAAAHNLKGNAVFSAAGTDSNKMKASEAEFRSAVRLDPKGAVYHLSLAKTLLLESKDSKDDEAKQELEACLGTGSRRAGCASGAADPGRPPAGPRRVRPGV